MEPGPVTFNIGFGVAENSNPRVRHSSAAARAEFDQVLR